MIYEIPGKSFPEVFEEFKEGKWIKRKSNNGCGCRLNKNNNPIFTGYDLLANDWIVME